MTWALAKVTKFFAILLSLRNSLKILKKLSISEDDDITERQKRIQLEQCSGILMFWTILGISVVGEQYFEFLFRWLPLYYYAKTFFILFMAFPKLKFTEYVFYKFLVPTVEFVHDNVGNISAMPPGDLLLLFLFQGVFVCFPMINHPDEVIVKYKPSVTDTLLVDSSSDDEGDDGIDLDDMLAEGETEIDLDEEFNEDNNIAADLSIKLDFDEDDSIQNVHVREKKKFTYCKKNISEANHSHVEEDDYSLSFSFDAMDKNDDNTDDGFSLSLPPISGYASSDEGDEKVEIESKSVSNNEQNKAVYESPSRVLRSFRKLLTGDSNTRLSETIFNLDLHSPPPNTQYRNRRKSAGEGTSPAPAFSTSPAVHTHKANCNMNKKACGNVRTPSSIFNLRRSASLQPQSQSQRKKLASSESPECYSPLHAASSKHEYVLEKNKIDEEVQKPWMEDSLDNIAYAKETHFTMRSRRGKKDRSDDDIASSSSNSSSEAKTRTHSISVAGKKEGSGHRVLRSSTVAAYAQHPAPTDANTQQSSINSISEGVPELRKRRVSESIVYRSEEDMASRKLSQLHTQRNAVDRGRGEEKKRWK